MPVPDWLAGGGPRRLQRALDRLEAGFAALPSTGAAGPALDRAARDYGRALGLALRLDPPLAVRLFRSYDARVPADRYALAFGPGDGDWLAELAAEGDREVLTVVFELAHRLRLQALLLQTRDRMAGLLGDERDANAVVARLRRWHDLGLLDADTLTRTLRGHLAHTPLSRQPELWSAFFDHVPETLLPELFEVHCFAGRGADAVRLADTPARRQQAIECCGRSPRLSDVQAGLELARGRQHAGEIRKLEEHAGDLLFEAGRYAEALARYQEAGRPDRASECHERLGRFLEALDGCPADQPHRLAHLAGLCQQGVDALVEEHEFTAAARRVRALLTHLDRAAHAADALSARRDEVAGQRAAVLSAGRRHFEALARRATAADAPGDPGQVREVYAAWSRFEEDAGELHEAGRRAEDGGDGYRAHRLYRRAEHFGDAERVLRADATPEGLTGRAEARAEGGDLLGSAGLYEQSGQWEHAVELFLRAGDSAGTARCLLRWRGDEAIEDPRLAECLRRTGDLDELVRQCLRAVERKGRDTRGAEELRRLKDDVELPPHLVPDVDRALAALSLKGRGPFEGRAQAWAARARADIDRRFAGIWALDLGTTTCAVAIYDTETRQPVLCPWKGQVQFAATLGLDEQGNELVGLAGEEVLAGWLKGHISAAKRKMGTRTIYRIRDRAYRPEEVAARLIRHARGLVESFLAARVRERVGELARAELGEVRDDWLSWAEDNHDLRLDRPRVIVTIPAYFSNNQKHATRQACEIAGVEAVRLIHEPTAACMTAARERRLTGRVVVVDLGAGTLDVSYLEVEENVYDVQQVLGDNNYGGKDLDAVISEALATRLERDGVQVRATGVARRRLDVAAEYLKVGLSSQQHADYALLGFAGDRDVRLELSRAELAEILAEPLRTLREVCAEFKASLNDRPQHLVLVGGPMLSPLVRDLVEEVFGLKRTTVSDPRTAVACGAALQAAVLDGKLEELLLLDVTPLPLGIRVFDDEEREQLSVLIDRNTHIPMEEQKRYTTHADNQSAVDIEIFNGRLDPQSKIGQFRLDDIPPAPRGVPQIQVTFAIDASCVLEVTARDLGTGRSNSIRVSDTTLLSPKEVEAMALRRLRQYERQHEWEELRQRLGELIGEAEDDAGEGLWREFRNRLSAHRPSSDPADAETQRLLAEMFNGAGQMELDLLLVREPLQDLATMAKDYLERGGRPDPDPAEAPAEEVSADLAQGRHLVKELRGHLGRLRPLLAQVTGWNALLVRLAVAEPDPLRRFRNRHDAGDHARALEALDELAAPLDDPADVRRQLRCLAEVGDADRYRDVLTAHAGLLGADLLELARPQVFLERARPALARITVAMPGGETAVGAGFLISDRLVLTNQHWLVGETGARRTPVEAERVEVGLGTGTRAVQRVFLPDSALGDMAVLRLAEPVAAAPLRLGHPRLVRIGDRVWAAGAAEPPALLPAIVDKFESFPEQNLHLFKTGLRLPSGCSGGPLFNDLGEVVGMLTIKEGRAATAAEGVFAMTVDALAPLLADAGFADPPGP